MTHPSRKNCDPTRPNPTRPDHRYMFDYTRLNSIDCGFGSASEAVRRPLVSIPRTLVAYSFDKRKVMCARRPLELGRSAGRPRSIEGRRASRGALTQLRSSYTVQHRRCRLLTIRRVFSRKKQTDTHRPGSILRPAGQ